MSRLRIRSSVPAAFVGVLFALALGSHHAAAQGYPGGGRGGGHGGMRPSQGGAQQSKTPAAQASMDPLASFLGTLHALRMEILVREDQVQPWMAMQDALRAYVDLGEETVQQLHNSAIDPLQRVHNLADDSRTRADALQKVSESMADLVTALDDHQRQVFGTRLADALAGGATRAQ